MARRSDENNNKQPHMSSNNERTFILRTYAKEGPWALLAVGVIALSGWVAWFFLNEYVRNNADAIHQLVTTQHDLSKYAHIPAQNAELLRKNTELLEQLLAERHKQTMLLEQILNELKTNNKY